MALSDSPNELPPGAARLPAMRPRRRRLGVAVLRLLLVLLIAGSLATFFRLELVNRAGPWLLTHELAVPVDLGVATFDWRSSHIDRLKIGRASCRERVSSPV